MSTTSSSSYDRSHVFEELKTSQYGVLCTFRGEGIAARTMTYACTPDLGRFYFLTHGSTQKIRELKTNPRATFTVSRIADDLEDYSDTVIAGSARLHDEFSHPRVQEGFRLLCEKSPMVQAMYDSGTLGEYLMIELGARHISYRIHRDIIRNIPATTFEFAS